MWSSCDLGTFEVFTKLLLGRPSHFPCFAASFLLFLKVAIFYGKSKDQLLILDYFFAERNSIWLIQQLQIIQRRELTILGIIINTTK